MENRAINFHSIVLLPFHRRILRIRRNASFLQLTLASVSLFRFSNCFLGRILTRAHFVCKLFQLKFMQCLSFQVSLVTRVLGRQAVFPSRHAVASGHRADLARHLLQYAPLQTKSAILAFGQPQQHQAR